MDSAAGVGGAGDAFSQEALRRASWAYPTRSPGFPIDGVNLCKFVEVPPVDTAPITELQH